MYLLDSAHVLHVAKAGNNANSGKAAQYPVSLANDAKLTIGSAVTAAASGDTIIIWPGDYAENVDATSKSLTIIGAHRNKSRIIPATGKGLSVADNSVVRNLSIEAVEISSEGVGLYAREKINIRVEECDIYGGFDGFNAYLAEHVYFGNCRIRGKYDGGTFLYCKSAIFEKCFLEGLGTYGAGYNSRAVTGSGSAIFDGCIFRANRSDATTEKECGCLRLNYECFVALNNCSMFAKGTNMAGPSAKVYGVTTVHADSKVIVTNSLIHSAGDAANIYDLYNQGGKIIVGDTHYTTSSGIIAHSSPKLNKVIKLLANKITQTKSSGIMKVYDDDGSTVLATLTPSEDETAITLTPS